MKGGALVKQFNYTIPTSSIKFSENVAENETWIQCMPLGKWEHPWYGEIEFNSDNVREYAEGVTNKILGQDLDIDYDHKMFGGHAAGWVKGAEARVDGLYLNVEWTPAARAAIENGEYKYFSPEYTEEWTHPATKVTHKNVLMGGGITNRPFLKGILPINLSELFETQQGVKMTAPTPPAGPPQPTPTPPAPTPPAPTPPAPTPTPTPEPSKLNDADAFAKALSEHPLFKQLSEKVTSLEAENKVLSAANHASSVEVQLSEFKSGAKVLSTAALDKLRVILSTVNKATSDEVLALIKMFTDKESSGVVELGEIGGTRRTGATGNPADAVKAFNDAVAALQVANKTLSYTDAAIKVSSEQPDVYTAYMDATISSSS
jgi:hypothetical protein